MSKMPRLIYIVGFMGAGKTSVGIRLAELLGWQFVDLDQEIERREGKPIRVIFESRGEAFFRALERAELERVSIMGNTVIALGGGAYCQDENRRIVEATGISVWLDVPLETIYARCAGDGTRPLFASLSEMERLLLARRPHYEKSQVCIEAGDRSVEAIAREIVGLLRL